MFRHGAFQQKETDYTFFYDETNNIRKFHLKNGLFNVQSDDNFVLGGILFDTKSQTPKLEDMFASLRIHKNILEVKLKHIATGDILSILSSKKTNTVLNWSLENIYIHYLNVDIWYWSIVDIVDSVDNFDIRYNREIKNIIYLLINAEKYDVLKLFNQFKYPNIHSEDLDNFKKEFTNLLCAKASLLSKQGYTIFTDFLNEFMNEDDFVFITNEKDNILIDNFAHFYSHSIAKFKGAHHILDNEASIIDKVNFLKSYDLKGVDYLFVDSKSMREIQLSDIVVGILGKYFTYIKNTNDSAIKSNKESLSDMQKNNLHLIANLIMKSDTLTPFTLESIMCPNDIEKSNHFLFNA